MCDELPFCHLPPLNASILDLSFEYRSFWNKRKTTCSFPVLSHFCSGLLASVVSYFLSYSENMIMAYWKPFECFIMDWLFLTGYAVLYIESTGLLVSSWLPNSQPLTKESFGSVFNSTDCYRNSETNLDES